MYRLKSPIRSLTLTEAKLSNLNEPNLGKNQEQIARFKQDEANGHILPVSLPVDRFTNGSRLGRTR